MQISRIQTTPIQRKQAPQTNFKGVTCVRIKAGDEILDAAAENLAINLYYLDILGNDFKMSFRKGANIFGFNFPPKYSKVETMLRESLNDVKQAYPKETQIITADYPNAKLADEMKKLAGPKKAPSANLGTIISVRLTQLDHPENADIKERYNIILDSITSKVLTDKPSDMEMDFTENIKTWAIKTPEKMSREKMRNIANYLGGIKRSLPENTLEFRISNNINATLEDEIKKLPN